MRKQMEYALGHDLYAKSGSIGWSVTHPSGFLGDRELHPPGASNCLTALRPLAGLSVAGSEMTTWQIHREDEAADNEARCGPLIRSGPSTSGGVLGDQRRFEVRKGCSKPSCGR